ncbi:ABC transporter permease [Dyadobacter jiangsuensis]
MIKSYLKIAWRSLIKDRQFTLLNLLGLSTGLACTLLIYLWVTDELRVDKHNAKDAHLFQVMVNQPQEDGIKTGEHTPGLLADALKAEMPEVEFATTVVPAEWFSNNGVVSVGETQLKAGGQFVSRDYFDVFTCPFTQGDASALTGDKNTLALSEEMAEKLFGAGQNVVGKTVKWDEGQFSGLYRVGGVFKSNPSNASNQFDILFNFEQFKARRPGMENWGNSDPNTFVILKNGADLALFNEKIRHFLKTKNKDNDFQLFAIRYSDKYLHGQFENGVQTGGRITYVRLFSVIAVFILVIACINFMNLSTAKASGRMKEVGIKKVVGALRSSLVMQHLSESLMLTLVSLFVAVGMVMLLLPEFNGITGKQIVLSPDPTLILAALSITLITGLLAGSYPALYLSGFDPVSVLKGKLKNTAGELLVRRGLVVFQFAVSVIFIVSVIVVYRQIQFIQNRNLGYNRDHLIHFEIPLEMDSLKLKAAEGFLGEVKNTPGVLNASSYYHNLTGKHGAISGFEWPGKPAGTDIEFSNLEVGYNFMETVGMTLREGRFFSQNQNARNEIIFNESAIKSMGLKDPVGKTVKFWGMERQIVGVVKDFNFESLYEPVKPCFFQMYPIMPNVMVKIQSGAEEQTIARLRRLFQDHHKGLVFDYQFLDENYKALYASERRVGVLSRYFAGLAIVISCLGLFGLAAFTAQRRQKEIGIRKVVGASVSNVVLMLSMDFIKLLVIALLIAFPLVGWVMYQWLANFAFRIDLDAGIFLIAAAGLALVTLATVGFQAVKAALLNPVTSLKME